MRRNKRWAAVIFSLALALSMTVPGGVRAEGDPNWKIGKLNPGEPEAPEAPAPNVQITTDDSQVYEFQPGDEQDIKITIKNTGNIDLTNVSVVPVLDTNTEQWPFDIMMQSTGYEQVIDSLPAGGEPVEVLYTLKARGDIAPATYSTSFQVTSPEGLDVKGVIYFKVATPEVPQEENLNDDPPVTPGYDGPGMEDFGGGVGNSGVTSNGKSVDSASVPRVIVSGFTTDPQSVTAGSNFRLVIHVQNTSKKMAVSNLLFDLQAPTDGADANTAAPAFLPASGSSSIYLDKIPAGETRDIAIELNARADLVQKPYSVALTMKYEDSNATQYESASSVSVPIQQAARFEFSEFEINPETIAVGEEGNVSCNIYNLGRTKLYNVKAKFEGEGIKAKDVFVGNVESGATASIDGMITGEKVTAPDNKVKMTVTYEDEGGALSTVEKELTLPVTEMAEEADMGTMAQMPEKKGFPVIPVVIGVLVAAGIVIGVVVYKKKKKKALQDEEDELADEIDRPSEDE